MDPVLRRRVLVPEESHGQAGDGILHCGDTVAFGRLLREVFDSLNVADPGRAIAVNLDIIYPPRPLIPNLSRSKDSFCAS